MLSEIECPACSATFPVDPNKIPESGVNARCSSCGHVIRVERPKPVEEAPGVPGVAMMIPSLSTQPLLITGTREGGFGRVLMASDVDGRRYALKTLKWELGLDRDKLRDEVVTLARAADQGGVVNIRGVDWVNGDPYIIMSYYPRSLADEINNRGKLPAEEVIKILVDVASTLAHLHDVVGMVHFDLKPANLLFAEDGSLAVADFGISRVLPEPSPDGIGRDLFLSGLTGTFAYMSPEQLLGRPVGPPVDIFALGVVAYEVLTGRHPFIASDFENTARNILTSRPRFGFRERIVIPDWLRDLTLSCVKKDPSKRPSARELSDALTSYFYEPASESPSQQADDDLDRELGRADSLYAAGHREEAQEILERCISEHPLDIRPLTALGLMHYNAGDPELAAELGGRALSLAKWIPQNPESLGTLYVDLANWYLSIDPMKSIDYAERATELDPNDWQAFGNIAEACRLWGGSRSKPDILRKGRKAVGRALELNPSDFKLRLTKAGLDLELRQFKAASEEVSELFHEHGGDNPHLQLLYIKLLIHSTQFDTALEWIKPMRGYPDLAPIVQSADQYLERYRREWDRLNQ
jgi:predicted Zn finger-like uncharacterized protein